MNVLRLQSGIEIPLDTQDVWDSMYEAKEKLTGDTGIVYSDDTPMFALARFGPEISVLLTAKQRDGTFYMSGALESTPVVWKRSL